MGLPLALPGYLAETEYDKIDTFLKIVIWSGKDNGAPNRY